MWDRITLRRHSLTCPRHITAGFKEGGSSTRQSLVSGRMLRPMPQDNSLLLNCGLHDQPGVHPIYQQVERIDGALQCCALNRPMWVHGPPFQHPRQRLKRARLLKPHRPR